MNGNEGIYVLSVLNNEHSKAEPDLEQRRRLGTWV